MGRDYSGIVSEIKNVVSDNSENCYAILYPKDIVEKPQKSVVFLCIFLYNIMGMSFDIKNTKQEK